ncbi:hypothetical protein ACT7DA_14195 [Bacillus pacificus]
MQKLLHKRAMQSPNLEALVGGGKGIRFSSIMNEVNQLAHYLLQSWLYKENRIGILCKNNHPFQAL